MLWDFFLFVREESFYKNVDLPSSHKKSSKTLFFWRTHTKKERKRKDSNTSDIFFFLVSPFKEKKRGVKGIKMKLKQILVS